MYPVTVATVLETKELWDELHACVQDLPVRFLLELSDTGDQAAFLEKLSRVSPDVVFLDVGKLKANAAETIRAIKAGIGSPAVIALNMEAEPTAILDSMRAGAAEFLYPPFGEQLRGALERISADRSKVIHSARRGGKVVGFLSAKGGCGATTIACHTAVDLPGLKPNTKVLLADLDFDAGLIGFLLKTKSTYSVLDAARNTQRLDANYWNALVSNGIPGVEIITAPPPPLQQHPRSDALRFVLNFSRANYDWIVVDLGRNLSLTTMSTLEQIDELFIVTTLEVPALHQTKLVVQKLLESGYQRKQIHLLLNRTPDRFDVTIQELEAMLDASVYSVIPNLYVALNDSYSEGKLIGRDTELGRHFDKLAMKIAGVEPPKKKKFSLFG